MTTPPLAADAAPALRREDLLEVLRRVWGYDAFLPDQLAAIEPITAGRDTLVVLPTGAGKSICYQLPAIALPGMAVVVSPLIALMRDQVDALRESGVAAASLDSSRTPEERRETAAAIRRGEIKVLYLSPERLALSETPALLAEGSPSFLAVDEAHCVSAWGHEFRPEYRQIAAVRERFPHLPMLACTATATEAVRADIIASLGLRDPAVVVGDFDRPNLVYRALPRRDLLSQLEGVIARHAGEAGIIYCMRRKDVDEIAAKLQKRGLRAVPYHAGLDSETRLANQQAFAAEKVDIVVATVAFGMGIDRSNVRFVAHAAMPKSLEAYQQEAGRAGRDRLEAECVLFYDAQDLIGWRGIQGAPQTEVDEAAAARLREMYRYCRTLACRHKALVEHFGGRWLGGASCGACDVCLNEHEPVADSTTLARKILSGVARLKGRFGARYVADVLKGSSAERIVANGHDALSTWGLLKEHASDDISDWIDQLTGHGLLVREGEYGTLGITAPGLALLKGEGEAQLARPREAKRKKDRRGGASSAAADLSSPEAALFEALRAERRALAAEKNVPAYIVLGDAVLRAIAERRPATLDALRGVKGIGDAKLRDYGERFLAVVRRQA